MIISNTKCVVIVNNPLLRNDTSTSIRMVVWYVSLTMRFHLEVISKQFAYCGSLDFLVHNSVSTYRVFIKLHWHVITGSFCIFRLGMTFVRIYWSKKVNMGKNSPEFGILKDQGEAPELPVERRQDSVTLGKPSPALLTATHWNSFDIFSVVRPTLNHFLEVPEEYFDYS